MKSLLAFLLLAGLSSPRPAAAVDYAAYSPPSRLFTCEFPAGWPVFEEAEPTGSAAHALGPDNDAGTYRAGLHIHWVESGRPGFRPAKGAVDFLRRPDKLTDRQSSRIKRVKVGHTLARVVEVWETRYLPSELAPSVQVRIHHFIGVLERGSGYYIVRLSSSEDVYVGFRETFLKVLKSLKAD